jgi:uncharacterized repeat protein (TIGR04002 family)
VQKQKQYSIFGWELIELKHKHSNAAVNSSMIRRPIRRWFPLFMGPMVCAFIIGFVYPFCKGIYLSFCKFKVTSDAHFVGLENYRRAFQDASFVHSFWFTALFAAMVFGLTMLHIPIGAGGYIHVGDAMIYLSGLLLGPWAFLAASIGAAFSDLASGFATYAIPSAIIKFLIAIPFVALYNKSNKLLTVWTALCTILSGAITVGGYYVADLVLYREGAIADIPANAIQAVGSAVVFIVLALALDKAGIYKRLKGYLNG